MRPAACARASSSYGRSSATTPSATSGRSTSTCTHLREKLSEAGGDPAAIATVRGAGTGWRHDPTAAAPADRGSSWPWSTSIATLVAATLTLLPPLEHRLERDQLSELRQLARAARLDIGELPHDRLGAGSVGARRVVRELRRRAGGEVALLGADDGSSPTRIPTRDESRTAPLPRRDDVREGVVGDDAVVRAAHVPGVAGT